MIDRLRRRYCILEYYSNSSSYCLIAMIVRDIEKQNRQEMLLAIIYLFTPFDKEICFAEIQKRVSQLQRRYYLGYYFLKYSEHSYELLIDIEDLAQSGYLLECNYRYDTLLSERYFKFSSAGVCQSKATVSQLYFDILEYCMDMIQ